MSNDEQATIIGRMVIERQELIKCSALLSEALRRLGVSLESLGQRIKDGGSVYGTEPISLLTDDELELLQSGDKINQLLAEAAEGRRRYHEICKGLTQAGL